MLLEKIKEQALAARKAKDSLRATLLVTLGAEAAREGKDKGNREPTDAEVVEVVRKFLKGVRDTLTLLPEGVAKSQAQQEEAILLEFLPTQVTGDALRAHVQELVNALPEKSPKAMGAVMGALRSRLAGNYDGKEAKELVQQALS